jgi:hypothetical protein
MIKIRINSYFDIQPKFDYFKNFKYLIESLFIAN